MEKGANVVGPNEAMKKEGQRIITEGNNRGLHLRLLGAIAFQFHCPKYSYFTTKLGRMLSDIDFGGYGKERGLVTKTMRDLGYVDQPMVTALWGDRRTIWDHKSNGMHVDIFFDKLEMNHDIPFRNRLELEPFTITLADMLLEKMQIVHINEKDIVDTIMLLREHEVGAGNILETIDAQYITGLLSNDWGFYYTVTTNLAKVREKVSALQELGEDDRVDVNKKIQTLSEMLEKQPKTLAWKFRAKIGTKNKWYRDVEEVRR